MLDQIKGPPGQTEQSRRGRPAAGHDPAKRKQILDGARRVFIDMGFDAASMNDITREAGVSKGTIYVYFANKEELFEAIVDEERNAHFNNLYEALDQGHSPRHAMTNFAFALAKKITCEHVVRAQRTVIGVSERMPEIGARFYERGPKRGQERLAQYLRLLVDKGLLALDDADLASYQLGDVAMAGLLRPRLFAYRTEPPSDEEIRRVVGAGVDMFLKAYGTEEFRRLEAAAVRDMPDNDA